MKNHDLRKFETRLLVANLITDVLISKKTVAQALGEFPKDKNDIAIKCAFDALVHREADEDLRVKIKDYALVQDEFLEDFAQILRKNLDLPKNFVENYLKFHSDDLIPDEKSDFGSFLKKMKRMINF